MCIYKLKKGEVLKYIDTMFFRLQITNIINYLTPLKTIRYTVVIHPLQKKQHLHQHHNTHQNSDHLDHCLVSPSVNFCHGSQLSAPQAGESKITYLGVDRTNLSTVFGQRQEDVQDLPVDTTSNRTMVTRPQNEQTLKESPLPGNRLF